MALKSDQSNEAESSSEIIEFSQNSLSCNNDADICSDSCSNLENQIVDPSARISRGLSSSFRNDQDHNGMVPSLAKTACIRNPSPTKDSISGDDASSQSTDSDGDSNAPECSTGVDGSSISVSRGLEVDPRLSMDFSSCNANIASEISGMSRQQTEGSSGATSSSVFSGKREVEGCSKQISETGSSSGPRGAGNNLNNYSSVQSNACSPPRLLIPPQSSAHLEFQELPTLRTRAGPHATSDLRSPPSTIVFPGRPLQNISERTDIRRRQNSVLRNSLATANAPLLSSPHQLFPGMRQNEFSVGSSSTGMSGVMPVPTMSRNLPQSPLTINSNLRAGASNERGQVSDIGNLSHYPQHYRPAIGSLGALGSASTQQPEYNFGFHPWPTVSRAPQPIHPAERRQAALEYFPRPLSLGDDSGSGVQNIGFVRSPRPTLYGYICDTLQQTGPSNLAQNPFPQGPSNSQSGHHPRRFGVPTPHVLQMMAAEIDRGREMIPEQLQQVMLGTQRSSHLQARGSLLNILAPAFELPGTMVFQDRHRDMRLDVDRMSYEELLALGEQIGTVRTGLREETIMELLKRRAYECDSSEPSATSETCCICRGEYVSGEEIGTLNCDHEFHTECIKQWLVCKNECPVCKVKGLGM